METEVLTDELRTRLMALQGVSPKRMFGADAYFVGSAMFAFFSPGTVVLRLPRTALAEAVSAGLARPFLSMGASHLNGWAEVPLEGRDPESLEPLLRSAHSSGTHAARSAARRKRPTRARRTSRSRP